MSKAFSKALVLRFPPNLTAKEMGEDMKMILEVSKDWDGDPIATFLTHQVSENCDHSVFSFGRDYVKHPDYANQIGFLPLDYAGIHLASFALKWATSVGIEENFNAVDGRTEKPRPFSKMQAPVSLVDPLDVPPALRFMATEAAKEEGEDFYKLLLGYGPGMVVPHQSWMQEQVIGRLEDRWPTIARADRALSGLVSKALETVAADVNYPRWWISLAVAFVRGNGRDLEKVCTEIITKQISESDQTGKKSPSHPVA